MTIFPKDPASDVDFSIDWSEWLTNDEAISSATWTIEPSDALGPTLGTETVAGPVLGVYVSGGVAGNRHKLTCRVATSAGRTAERSLTLRIMER